MFMLLKKKTDKAITCNDCKFFNNDPKILESLFPGILILSSFHSSSRGDAGICTVAKHLPQLSFFYLVAHLGTELEVVTLVVNRP